MWTRRCLPCGTRCSFSSPIGLPSSSTGWIIDGALAAALLAQADLAGDLGHDGGLARPAGLEDFRDARQTAGDVLRAADLARRLGQQGAGRDLLALAHLQVGLLGDVVELPGSGRVRPR